ncbi:hypothetical protein [Rufibacter sp. XAAS-G3-1]|uniref:hypothetical protein n=1 Tax=Rufibacter sp. XAAS-G3-1 TaxID=2729134 RepID=UPI0015E70FA5|nr:hypothetical protein [Rufibacter sp. XAAS-G3-1]
MDFHACILQQLTHGQVVNFQSSQIIPFYFLFSVSFPKISLKNLFGIQLIRGKNEFQTWKNRLEFWACFYKSSPKTTTQVNAGVRGIALKAIDEKS